MPSPSTFRDPPTPSSINTAPSPTASVSANDYFSDFVESTLASRARSATPNDVNQQELRQSSTTPTINRKMTKTVLIPGESPDPLALPGPSPTKRHRPSAKGQVSPALQASSSKIPKPKRNGFPSSSHTSLGLKLHPTSPTERLLVEVEIPIRAKGAGPSRSPPDDESEEDDLDWGDGEVPDGDGDWQMEPRSYRSPSPGANGKTMIPKGSGRTGERDVRSEQPLPRSIAF